MKKTIYLTVALLLSVTILVACSTNAPASSENELGGLEDNTVFDNPSDGGDAQQSTSSTAPSSSTQDVTQPSADSATQPSDSSGEVTTQPSTGEVTTQPSDSSGEETTQPSSGENSTMDYKTFQAMTGAEQRAFQDTFESLDAFFEWYNAAKETYEKENPPIDVGDGVIDMEDLVGGNG